MVDMKGLTLQQLQKYDASNDEVQQWMLDNIHLWGDEKEKHKYRII